MFALVSTSVVWQVDDVVVSPGSRDQGIAASLVNAVLNRALEEGAPLVTLASEERLRALYESGCGFTVAESPGVHDAQAL